MDGHEVLGAASPRASSAMRPAGRPKCAPVRLRGAFSRRPVADDQETAVLVWARWT